MHYRNIQGALHFDWLKGEANWASHIIVRNKMVHVLVGWIGKHVKCHALSQGIRCFGFWLVESESQLNVTLNRKVYWVHCILIGFEQTQLSATMICVLIGSKEKPTKCHVTYHKFSTHTRSVVFTHSKYIYIFHSHFIPFLRNIIKIIVIIMYIKNTVFPQGRQLWNDYLQLTMRANARLALY